VWLLLAGRGFGKNRTAVECIARLLRGPSPLIASPGAPSLMTVVADNGDDLRRFSIMGPSGFLNVGPPDFRPNYSPGYKELRWSNGARALLFSAEDPDSLRGASGDLFWADELAKYKRAQDCWDNMLLGMREGFNPRGIVTTTPRPISLIKRLIRDPGTHVTVGSTWENASNIPKRYYERVIRPLEGTRLGRQEIDAEVIEDLQGALWTRLMVDDARASFVSPLPDMQRIVVAVDPSGARDMSERASSHIGIVVCGKGVDGRGYVLADRSCKLPPGQWARRAIDAYNEFRADRLVAERNFGGAMVEATIKSARRNDEWVSYEEVVASRGKVQRAEPIAALYERGLVSHAAGLELLEDQMCQMGSDGYAGEGSPDRVDAMVWAMSSLMTKSTYDATLSWVG
jgi:predicted phage terminase large subunit-like protein